MGQAKQTRLHLKNKEHDSSKTNRWLHLKNKEHDSSKAKTLFVLLESCSLFFKCNRVCFA
jgi:hypothetical protein